MCEGGSESVWVCVREGERERLNVLFVSVMINAVC